MVRSMTGYGRGTANGNAAALTVELKSVNHRFFECSIKLPRQLNFAEDRLKAYLQSRISRGKIDVFVTAEFAFDKTTDIEINGDYVKKYIEAARKLSEEFGVDYDVTVSKLMRDENVCRLTAKELDEEEVWVTLQSAAESAVDAFLASREAEGTRLAADIIAKADNILGMVAFVESRAPETVSAYRERLLQKMQELLADKNVDEQRLITETAIFADHVATDEETVRLRSHIAHLKELFNDGGVIGKQLDFTVQEMNRETNTIGSKCQNVEISHTVVNMKSEIEKIREQIQNIE